MSTRDRSESLAAFWLLKRVAKPPVFARDNASWILVIKAEREGAFSALDKSRSYRLESLQVNCLQAVPLAVLMIKPSF